MKIPLAAVTLVIAGLGATPVNPPAPRLEALATGRKVLLMPPLELNPHVALNQPVQFSALRRTSASATGARLNRLDDRVSDLKARADLAQLRRNLDPDFEHLKALRANVVTALLNLRNPMIGLDAAESALADAVHELELSIEAVGERLEQLDPPLVS